MRNALVYHIASGQAFFVGVLLLELAALGATELGRGGLRAVRNITVCLAAILIAASATPLPLSFYAVAGALTFGWLIGENRVDSMTPRSMAWLRGAVEVVWIVAVMLEWPYHVDPTIDVLGHPTVYIVGDSLGAGVGGESVTWPKVLSETQELDVVDLSRPGATVNSARESQADRVNGGSALVLVEIGGNDILRGTPPDSFERGLDALLGLLTDDHRTVVMLELPLPPFYNRYGAIQRRLAQRHRVRLVPRRVLLGVLTTQGATTDSLHFTEQGHRALARRIWRVIRPAFDR